MKTSAKCQRPPETEKMAQNRHYSPPISRQLVRVLYFERIRRGIPMTKLVEEIIAAALAGTESWRRAEEINQTKSS